MIEDRLKDVAKEADREKALNEVVKAIAKDKVEAAKDAEERTRAAERARALAEQKLMETNVKLGGTKLKLAEAESLNLAQANEISEQKATLEACEDKWYNVGFADAKTPWNQSSTNHGNMGSMRDG